MISLIHPSRGRPEKSFQTISKWLSVATDQSKIKAYVSIDVDDAENDKYVDLFVRHAPPRIILCTNKNRSAVDAINNAAISAYAEWADILIVVSDDTDCFSGWDTALLNEVRDKTDWILKTQDGIQPWIITMPVMDNAYYNRTGNIYDPDFKHMFCDTWLTVMADLSGRKITSSLKFPHLNDSIKDDVRKRSDATWEEGERMFIHKIQQLPIEDLRKVQDRAMLNWIRNKTGIRV